MLYTPIHVSVSKKRTILHILLSILLCFKKLISNNMLHASFYICALYLTVGAYL